MPHALSDRLREYLEFIRGFIKENESSPRLEEIAAYFGVKSPTAHKALKSLQAKGFLYTGRDSISGFYIRLIERSGSAETVLEVPIAGKVNDKGEVLEFPKKLGHFVSVVVGPNTEKVFALALVEDLPQAQMRANDLILFEYDSHAQAGDICIFPFGGGRHFLIQLQSKTFDKRLQSLVMRQEYPIPKNQSPDREQLIHWFPLAFDDANEDYFYQLAKETGLPEAPMKQELIVAVAFRLSRQLAF